MPEHQNSFGTQMAAGTSVASRALHKVMLLSDGRKLRSPHDLAVNQPEQLVHSGLAVKSVASTSTQASRDVEEPIPRHLSVVAP